MDGHLTSTFQEEALSVEDGLNAQRDSGVPLQSTQTNTTTDVLNAPVPNAQKDSRLQKNHKYYYDDYQDYGWSFKYGFCR